MVILIVTLIENSSSSNVMKWFLEDSVATYHKGYLLKGNTV